MEPQKGNVPPIDQTALVNVLRDRIFELEHERDRLLRELRMARIADPADYPSMTREDSSPN